MKNLFPYSDEMRLRFSMHGINYYNYINIHRTLYLNVSYQYFSVHCEFECNWNLHVKRQWKKNVFFLLIIAQRRSNEELGIKTDYFVPLSLILCPLHILGAINWLKLFQYWQSHKRLTLNKSKLCKYFQLFTKEPPI